MIQRLEENVMSIDQDRLAAERHSQDLRSHCLHTGAAFAFEFVYPESISAIVLGLALAFSSELALQRRQQTPSMPRKDRLSGDAKWPVSVVSYVQQSLFLICSYDDTSNYWNCSLLLKLEPGLQ